MSKEEACPREELIAAYLAQDLSPQEEAALDAHLESCAVCRQALEGDRAVGSALRSLPLPAAGEEARKRAYAAVLAAMEAKSAPAHSQAQPVSHEVKLMPARPRPRNSWVVGLTGLLAAACLLLIVDLSFRNATYENRHVAMNDEAARPPRPAPTPSAPTMKTAEAGPEVATEKQPDDLTTRARIPHAAAVEEQGLLAKEAELEAAKMKGEEHAADQKDEGERFAARAKASKVPEEARRPQTAPSGEKSGTEKSERTFQEPREDQASKDNPQEKPAAAPSPAKAEAPPAHVPGKALGPGPRGGSHGGDLARDQEVQERAIVNVAAEVCREYEIRSLRANTAKGASAGLAPERASKDSQPSGKNSGDSSPASGAAPPSEDDAGKNAAGVTAKRAPGDEKKQDQDGSKAREAPKAPGPARQDPVLDTPAKKARQDDQRQQVSEGQDVLELTEADAWSCNVRGKNVYVQRGGAIAVGPASGTNESEGQDRFKDIRDKEKGQGLGANANQDTSAVAPVCSAASPEDAEARVLARAALDQLAAEQPRDIRWAKRVLSLGRFLGVPGAEPTASRLRQLDRNRNNDGSQAPKASEGTQAK